MLTGIIAKMGHYEAYYDGEFISSADTYHEAELELYEYKEEKENNDELRRI